MTPPNESTPPPLPGQSASARPQGDATGGLIPYKNPKALIAYYLGIFSLIPVIGFFPGIAAFVLGILGLRYRKGHPESRGAAHAWIGIVLGSLVVLGHVVFIGLIARSAS